MLNRTISKKRKIITALTFGATVAVVAFGYYFYQIFYAKNVLVGDEAKRKEVIVFINPNTDFTQFANELYNNKIINDQMSFMFVAKFLNYNTNLKGGKYKLRFGMSNLELVRYLRSGNQEPVQVTFSHARTKEDLAAKIAQEMAFSAEDLLSFLNSSDSCQQLASLDTANIIALFLPDTYQFYWDSSVSNFMQKMKKEYDKFWNDERKMLAQTAGLTQKDVSIIASIVNQETNHAPEMPTVAGVYINRIHKGMLLQADPTVKFALRDFELKRILYKHLEFDSPYNTYKYAGIPPGPICMPSKKALDAVLKYQKHDYLFFCAKDDNSGTHVFARTNAEHEQNARRYHAFLDRLAKQKKAEGQ